MALIKSPLFDGLWGKIGDLEFRMRKNKKIELAKKRIPMDRKSEAQLKQRERYKNCLQQYYNLTPEQLKQYEEIGRKQKLDAFRAFMAECLKASVGLTFDNDGGGTWNRYINIPIASAPAEYAQYKIELNGDKISVYSADGTLKTQGTGMTDFWNNVKTDGADIRAFDNNKKQLYFYIETFDYVNKQAIIWVRVEAGDAELNIAYGNPSATKSTYENGDMVFEFFDDFEGTNLDTTKWEAFTSGGNYSVANSYVTLSPVPNQTNAVALRSNVQFVNDIIVEAKVNPTSNTYYDMGLILNKNILTDSWHLAETDNLGYSLDAQTVTETNRGYYLAKRISGTKTILTPLIGGGQTLQEIIYKLAYTSSGLLWGQVEFLDGTIWSTLQATDTTYLNDNKYIVIWQGEYYTGWGGPSSWDWVRVLKLADPASFGTPAIITI